LQSHDVVVMDEAGMTDSVSLLPVLKAVREAQAKLVLVGDHAQIQPVGPGASFRSLIERLGFAEIQTVYRQKEEWQRDATVHLSAGRVRAALSAYSDHDCLHFTDTTKNAMTQLVDDWFIQRQEGPKDLSQYFVIAHRNEDVHALNNLLRAERVHRLEIAEGHTVATKKGTIKLAQGDRILFLKNDRKLDVANGRFATVNKINFTESGKVIDFTVLLDGDKKAVLIDPAKYNDFDYGYAATVHKSQGMTVDHAFLYAGGTSWNRHLAYVALSRHRETCHLYASREEHQSLDLLQRNLAKLSMKDSLLDFPLAFAERRGIDTSVLLKLLPQRLRERLQAWREKLNEWSDPIAYAENKKAQAEEKFAAEKIREQREEARYVANYVDLNRDVGVSFQAFNTKINSLGLDDISYEKDNFALISNTKEYLHFQSAIKARNQAAHHLMQAPDRYQKALEIYTLDIAKLQKQAEKHDCYERIHDYVNYCKSGTIIHRDRLAFAISQNIKAHYPYFKQFELNNAELKAHALAHQKRQFFRTLTAEERINFKMVEAYQDKVKQIGNWWAKEIKSHSTPLSHFVIKRLEALSNQRDQLAYDINQQRERYAKALDFYKIGSTSFDNEKLNEEAMHEAQTRWYRLQDHAARHEIKKRVEAYHQALFVGDIKTRMVLSHEVMEAGAAHHAAIVHLGVNTKEIWRNIRRDAKLYEHHNHCSQLNAEERIAFKNVEKYVTAKLSTANAWRELFASKKAANLDEKTFNTKLASYATRYTIERDECAALILKDVSLHQSALDYFKVNAEELAKSANKHQCRNNIENYLHEKEVISRAQIAVKITADPKNHHGLINEKGLNWKSIYQDARIAERKALFAFLNYEEKSIYRLADRYRDTNKKAGKLFAYAKSKSTRKIPQQKIDHAFIKRDYLAWRLVNAIKIYDTTSLEDFANTHKLNSDKLCEQHARYIKHLTKLERSSLVSHQSERKVTKAMKESAQNTELVAKTQTASVNRKTATEKEIKNDSLKTLISRYINLELQQTQLVNEMHLAKLKDPKSGQILAKNVIAHANQIKDFAKEVLHHPEIKEALEKLKVQKPASLAQRGGFASIRERMSKGEWLKEDIAAVLVQLRGKGREQSQVRLQEKDRGARIHR
ncbi:MAG: AAA family ATPase, partial [Gammaproteobacteria bacterium]|nr:AAA family ATPase [Gammaproteobacteria bacterium]